MELSGPRYFQSGPGPSLGAFGPAQIRTVNLEISAFPFYVCSEISFDNLIDKMSER